MDRPKPTPRPTNRLGVPPPPPTKPASANNSEKEETITKFKTALTDANLQLPDNIPGWISYLLTHKDTATDYVDGANIKYDSKSKSFVVELTGAKKENNTAQTASAWDAAQIAMQQYEEEEGGDGEPPAYGEGEDQGKTMDNREGSTVALAGKAQKVKGAKTPSERIKSIIGGINPGSKYRAAKDTAINLLKKTFNELNDNDLEIDWRKIQSYLLTSADAGNPEKFDIKHGDVSLTLNVELSKGKILILQEIKKKKEIQQLDQASIKHIPQFACKNITRDQMYILLCDPRILGKDNGYKFDKGYGGHEEWKRTLKDKKYAGYLSFWDNNMDLVERVMKLPSTLRDTFLLELLRLARKVNDGKRTLLYYLFVYDNEFLRILCEDIIKYLELDGIKRKTFGTSATKYIYYYPGKIATIDRTNPIEKYLYYTVTVDTKLFVKLTEVDDKVEKFGKERYINPQRVTVKRANGGVSKVGISAAKTKLQRFKQYLPWGKTKTNKPKNTN